MHLEREREREERGERRERERVVLTNNIYNYVVVPFPPACGYPS